MGNAESNVTSGIKKQTDTTSQTLYTLVDLKGGGLLVELMKKAMQTKNYEELDEAIQSKVTPYIYNNGKGKMIHIAQVVLMRNKDRPRHKMLGPLKTVDDVENFDVEKNLSLFDGYIDRNTKDPTKYREVAWDLNLRGAVGETILHLCLLNSTSTHAELAKRLIKHFPKLINDIYQSEEYYGENVLHMAIVNEDPAMVKFLLDNGVNFNERCIGNFMFPEDQKASRGDSFEFEHCTVNPDTNYEGVCVLCAWSATKYLGCIYYYARSQLTRERGGSGNCLPTS